MNTKKYELSTQAEDGSTTASGTVTSPETVTPIDLEDPENYGYWRYVWDGEKWDNLWVSAEDYVNNLSLDGEPWEGDWLEGEPWDESVPTETETNNGAWKEFLALDPPKDEVEVDGGDESWIYGLFWDPVTCEQVELAAMTHHVLNNDGGWTAFYSDNFGQSYSLTCLKSTAENTYEPPATVDATKPKITYTPVTTQGAEEFNQRAWPASSKPASSGLDRQEPKDSLIHRSGSDSSDENPFAPGHKKGAVAATMRCALGSKPSGNKPGDVLETSVLTNMTLQEHIQHVKWYTSPAQFRGKMPDDISDDLWGELVEIFICYHAYDIEDPEVVLWVMKKMHSNMFPVQFHGVNKSFC